MPKHHYTLTKIQKVIKYNRTPLMLCISVLIHPLHLNASFCEADETNGVILCFCQGSGSSGRAALSHMFVCIRDALVSSAVSPNPAVTVAWRSLSISLLFQWIWSLWVVVAGWFWRVVNFNPFIAVVPWGVVLFLVECGGYFSLFLSVFFVLEVWRLDGVAAFSLNCVSMVI